MGAANDGQHERGNQESSVDRREDEVVCLVVNGPEFQRFGLSRRRVRADRGDVSGQP